MLHNSLLLKFLLANSFSRCSYPIEVHQDEGILAIRPQVRAKLHIFSLRMRETAIYLIPVKNLTSPSCSLTPISHEVQKFWRFGHKYGPNCIFLIAHARNGRISTSGQKSDVTIVFPDPIILYIIIIVCYANKAAQNHKSTVEYETTEDIPNT